MKQRNYVQKALLKFHPKSGAHEKSNKAKRRKDKVDLMKDLG